MIEYIFLILFFIVAIVEVYGEWKDNTKIEFSTKPLLMPLLILFYVFGVVEGASIARVDWLIVVALIGGCAGDVLLMLKNQEKLIKNEIYKHMEEENIISLEKFKKFRSCLTMSEHAQVMDELIPDLEVSNEDKMGSISAYTKFYTCPAIDTINKWTKHGGN